MTQEPKPPMNLAPLNNHVTEVGLVLAGMVTRSDDTSGFEPEQLGILMFASVAAFAKTLPDYNPEQDIASVIKLGVAVYAEGIHASILAANDEAEKLLAEQADQFTDGQEILDELPEPLTPNLVLS